METMRLANNSKTAWLGSEKGSLDPKKQRNFGSMDSPLATQLQQAWLQTQLPKRNVPKLDFLSPLPSPDLGLRSSSSSFSNASPPSVSPDSLSDTYTSQYSEVGSISPHGGADSGEYGAESEPMDDEFMLQFLSEVLMEEDMGEKHCMYAECSAYQAMTKELADLIGAPGPTDDMYCEADTAQAVDNWVDEVLRANPQDYLRDNDGDNLSADLESLSTVSFEPSVTSHPKASRAPHPIESNASQTKTSKASQPVPRLTEAPRDLDCIYLDGEQPTTNAIDYSNGRSAIESLMELYPLLTQCAQAVAADDVRVAHQVISELRQKCSPFGDGGQRMAYYVVEALVARLSGTGAQLYTAMSSNRPSASQMLEAYRLIVQCNPLPRISHFFSNATIYKAIEGVERVHIIDFGILYGVQWPCLLRKLALRPGGPPHVRITGIDFPQPGFHKTERVEETGRRLAAKAKQLGVEFEYHAIAGKWETIQPAQLTLRQDEVLIVNCVFRLRNLLDETVMASSPRKMVLAKIHSLNPRLFVMGVISAGYNTPFFMSRFRETMNHYASLFDIMHTCLPPDAELRLLAEREILGREILNIIACEGPERIERAQPYRQWHSRVVNAGFKQEPIHPLIYDRAIELLKRFNINFGVAQDGDWLLTGWKDRVIHGLSSWRPA